MIKGEILEITVRVRATADLSDTDAMACAAYSIERAMEQGARPGLSYLAAQGLVKRVGSGIAIKVGSPRRKLRRAIYRVGGRSHG